MSIANTLRPWRALESEIVDNGVAIVAALTCDSDVIRPPEAGAKLLGVVTNQKFPGLVKIVTRGEFVGVVCEREEQAIRAARSLKVNWSKPAGRHPTKVWSARDELSRAPHLHGADRSHGCVLPGPARGQGPELHNRLAVGRRQQVSQRCHHCPHR
jgi:hypothetical protein